MLRPRVIVCLDVKDGRVVKGTQFKNLRDVGDPVELARRYEEEGADEIVYLDVSASKEERGTLLDVVRRTAETLFVRDPELLSVGAERFGSQCIVASIDAAAEGDGWRCYTHGGSTPTDLDAVSWARECVERGAGEILLTSIDQDGARNGYRLDLTRAVADAVSVPVIASGGAGEAKHLHDAFTEGHASAALVAGILHDGLTTVRALKEDLAEWGVDVRPVVATHPSRPPGSFR
jgi:cyclase